MQSLSFNTPKSSATCGIVRARSLNSALRAFLAVVLCGFLPGSGWAAQVQRLHNATISLVSHIRPVGRLDGSKHLRLAISLPLRNSNGLGEFLSDVYSPSSPNYRKFLNPEQFAERFGPAKEDYQTVIAFARSNGLAVTGTHSNRTILDVEGAVADIEKTFHVKMQVYQHPTEGRQFYAPDSEPSADLPVALMRVSGLDNYFVPRPNYKMNAPGARQAGAGNSGSGPGGTYSGNDFRAAYVPGSPLSGFGQTVGLLEFDGYTTDDITYYENQAGLPNVPLTNVLLDGFSGAPTGDGGEVEVSLDIEMAISMAPGLSNVLVYEAGPAGSWHDILNRMATDNQAKEMSCSWYIPGGAEDPVADQIFLQMAAQGQTFYSASGDEDAYTGLIPFPGDTPYITEVGGTTLSTSGPGGARTAEIVWNWGGGVGSGGGISTHYAIPGWQEGINMSQNQGSTLMRNVPDVAMVADNIYVRVDGQDDNVGGISCAAPLWAAFTALVNQQAMTKGQPVGFVNPALYSLGQGSSYPSDFEDIVTGNNFSPSSPSLFSAVPGYDLCTGLGSPGGNPLIDALAGPPDLLSVSFSYLSATGPAGGPFLPNTATYTLANTGTTSVSWSASVPPGWLTLSATGGTIAIGGSTTVIASINTAARSLAPGTYSTQITFLDITTGASQPRYANLTIPSEFPVMTVTPTTGFTMGGPPGGSFNPSTVTYLISNAGEAPMSWAVSNTAAWLSVSPAGGTLSAGGTTSVTATPTAAAAALATGTYNATVTFSNLNNGTGNLSAPATLLVWPPPPVITSATNATTDQGANFTYQIAATNNPIGYRANGLPQGLSLNADTGLISGTATVSGTVDATIQAINLGGTGSATLAMLVVPEPPVIDSSLAVTGTYSAGFTYQIAATNGPTSFSTSQLPAGLSVNSATGLISGTPASASTIVVTIRASNGAGTGSANLTITIKPMPVPVITNPAVTLCSFNDTNGANPLAGLIQGSDGNLYGTTSSGGANYYYGTVFKLSLSGSLTTLTSFNGTDGYEPEGGLVQATDGNLYGTTYYGGEDFEGSVFRVTTSGSLTNLVTFSNFEEPLAGLIQAKSNTFYGTTSGGGVDYDGSIFTMSLSGSISTITSFNYTDGDEPEASLMQVGAGNLYGTTAYGGTDGDGTVFTVTTGGTLGTEASFNGTNGDEPLGGLVQGSDGNFYGTTAYGGSNGDGTVFRWTPGGALVAICSFSGTNGANPEAGLVVGSDGNFYGTTYAGGASGFGTVFKVTTGGVLTTICNFTGANGQNPAAPLIQLSDGYFYGTTSAGGSGGDGTVFKVGSFTATAVVGTPFSYQITASNSPTTYNVVNLPPGLEFNATTGIISGTPTATADNPVTITATNAGGTTSTIVTFNVVLPPLPVFTSVLQVTAVQGQYFAYQLQASGGPATFNATNLPPGLTYNAASGLISGIPTAPGATKVALTATNPAGVRSATLDITVVPAAPVISAPPATLYSFDPAAGSSPAGGVIQGTDGNFYGTTQSSGAGGAGALLQVTSSGSAATLASLSWALDGAYPQGSLLEANDGNLYGTAQSGGSNGEGTIFQASLSGSLSALCSFNYANGAEPMGGLVQGSDGNLYGTTEGGGSAGQGTVVNMTLSGSLTMLCSFTGSNGAEPMSGVVEGTDGNYYGTTLYGGSSNLGEIFKVTTSGSLTGLCSFTGSNGAEPIAGLVEGSDGNFYGTTLYGGSENAGVVFKVTTSGSLTTLCSFDNADGANPYGALIEGGDGNLYGTTSSGGNSDLGTIFEVTPAGSVVTLYSFTGEIDGSNPQAGLVQGDDGNLYGTTTSGGGNGTGTIFGFTPLYVTGRTDQPFSYQITATNNPASYNATPLPTGLNINMGTGVISGTPAGPGSTSVTISATNAGGTGTATLDIIVLPLPPVMSGNLSATAIYGEAFQYPIQASNNPASYTASPLPAGLSLDMATGLISGTATVTGTTSVTITAANSGGAVSGTLSIAVLLPPASVSTGAASGVTYDGAALNGYSNPNGLDTLAYFEIGTTTAYGGITPSQDIGSGTSSVQVTGTVGGLMPNTTYHYRLDGSNGTGLTLGNDEVFTTPAPPPAATTGTGLPVFYDDATVGGSIDPNGLATTAYFEYGTTASYGSMSAPQNLGDGTGSVLFSGSLAGLSPDTVYHYAVVAINSSGTTVGLDETFTTLPPPPSVATNPATGILYNSAGLNGTVNPNGLDSLAYFQWGATAAFGNSTAAQDMGTGSSPAAISAGLSGLAANTNYYFQLVSASSSGTSYGISQSLTTAPPPPTAATGAATNLIFQGATLTGSVNPNGLDTTVYFQYGATIGYGSTTSSQDVGNGTDSIAVLSPVTGLPGLGGFHYCIVATNSSGTVIGADQTFSTGDSAPVAVDDEAYTPGTKTVKIDVLANDYDLDGDTVKVVAVTQGLDGGVVINTDSTVTYIPGPGFKTADHFTYTISDSYGNTATASVYVHNGFISGAGLYSGLVSGIIPLNENSGLLDVSVARSGEYTGRLMFAGLSYRVRGSFDSNMSSSALIARSQQPSLAMTLELDPATQQITGVVTTPTTYSQFTAAQASYDARINPASQQGEYTALMTPAPAPGGSDAPQAIGTLSLKVNASGAVTAKGLLGDGTKVSASGVIVSGSNCPLYMRAYGSTYPYAGGIFGNLDLGTGIPPKACNGIFYWFKPRQKNGQGTPASFGTTVTVQGVGH